MAEVQEVSLQERFVACMVLGGVGDALGYKNGYWEFMRQGKKIHENVQELGGVEAISVTPKNYRVSDDTIMHIATAEALLSDWRDSEEPKKTLYSTFARKYKDCMKEMQGRAPGMTCSSSTHRLRPDRPNGWHIPFNMMGGGCGAAMRAVPIGLYFSDPSQLEELIAVSIESGRMTHNHPTGFLGAMAVALFTSYAIQNKPLIEWGIGLLEAVEKAEKYIEKQGRDVPENKMEWPYFKTEWQKYLKLRGIEDGKSMPVFPEDFDVVKRDKFYKSVSFSGVGGASGHDAPLIAYDAILGAGDSWIELCHRGVFHGGDSDSTGILAAAWWGAIHGFGKTPEKNYKHLEFRDHLAKLADQIFTSRAIL